MNYMYSHRFLLLFKNCRSISPFRWVTNRADRSAYAKMIQNSLFLTCKGRPERACIWDGGDL